jgi:2-haloacid dehalogenase
MIKVIAFDVFNTVFRLDGRPKQEVYDYGDHIKKKWEPLKLPVEWETLPAHDDAAEGIARLRKKYMVATLSNGPLGLLAKVSKHNNISWDAIVPLELGQVFKPSIGAYMLFVEVLGFKFDEVMMVTANKTFGDLEAAQILGMKPQLIRDSREDCPQTIIELATQLGV